jgi:hypothetical protein
MGKELEEDDNWELTINKGEKHWILR